MSLRIVTLFITHLVAAGAGFALGIYLLPILIAPPAPDAGVVANAMTASEYVGEFSRDRQDSDFLHWGEGTVSINAERVVFSGELAPGPDYRLYLSPEFVETEADFNRLKTTMVEVGAVKTFENFVVELPQTVDPSEYSAAIVWCESFGEFITSGTYQRK